MSLQGQIANGFNITEKDTSANGTELRTYM